VKKAVLFDVDGVIADSEKIGLDVFDKTIGKYDIYLTEEEKKKFMGVTDEICYRELSKSRNIKLDINKLLKEHFEIYEKELQGVDILPYVEECVTTLKKRYKLAVVSGSTSKQVDIILKKAKIKKYFDIKITCENYKKSKPNPEPYLTAAKKLNVRSNECIVIEDAPTGIASGKAAGMFVIAVKVGNFMELDLSEADLIIEDLSEVDVNLIESI